MSFLSVFDLIRYILGLYTVNFLVCIHDHKRRNEFVLRIIILTLIGVGLALCQLLLNFLPGFLRVLDAVFWIALSLTGALFIYFAFSVNKTVALYKNLLGSILQQIPTILIRYLFDNALFVGFSIEHTVAYVFITIGTYALFYTLIYFLLIRRMFTRSDAAIKDTRSNFVVQIVITLLFSLTSSLISGVFDSLLPTLELEQLQLDELKYFCIWLLLSFCIIAFVLEWSIYNIGSKRYESDLLKSLVQQRENQYQQSRETIAAIKRQSHDLKHAIKAIQLFSTNEQKEEYINQIISTISKYDAFIKTSSPVLSTLLTEKSLQCVNLNIRFSCSIIDDDLSFIEAIDLYTSISNALENAIESVKKISEEDKKVISFKMEKKVNFLVFNIQNYYEGKTLNADTLRTTKRDAINHGLGLKSIQLIAEKYNGSVSIDTSDNVFSLSILFEQK